MASPFGTCEVDARANGRQFSLDEGPIWLSALVGVQHDPVPGSAGTIEHDPLHEVRRNDNRYVAPAELLGHVINIVAASHHAPSLS